MMKRLFVVSLLSAFAIHCFAEPQSTQRTESTTASKTESAEPAYDAELTSYEYPFEVKRHQSDVQQLKVEMAYMDIKPEGKPDAPVIVLLHGKNFGGYAFADVARRLQSDGYRVFMPDQIGFGKSTKPERFQYTFQALATLTDELLQREGITSYTLLGHSMGGMLATRMALMYPDKVRKLILVNPIGLEDWKLLTSYKTIDEMYERELKIKPADIKKYQRDAYYSGDWKPEYDKLIEAASGWTRHQDYPRIAWNSALTYDMVFTQPVIYEFEELKVPTVLIIGQLDRTAPGKAWAPEENKPKMGLYPQLGKKAQELIPDSKLYELENLGHVPFIEDIDRFFNEGLNPALK